MRNSCNGCRILRKGCSENCTIRPCLEWIKSSEAQANATAFLAKFYGRAGLINLIGSGPDHLRPAIFRSLLYEACGRIVNPVHGSVGLMWTGSWHLWQTAVQAVLRGDQITQTPIDPATSIPAPPIKGPDIRHVSMDLSRPPAELHVVAGTRTRFKKLARKVRPEIRTGSESVDGESEGSHVSQVEPDPVESGPHEDDVELDLTLGLATLGPGI